MHRPLDRLSNISANLAASTCNSETQGVNMLRQNYSDCYFTSVKMPNIFILVSKYCGTKDT